MHGTAGPFGTWNYPGLLGRLTWEIATVSGMSQLSSEYAKEVIMACAMLVAGRWAFLYPDRVLLFTKAREVSPSTISKILIRGVALLFALGGSWVLCSLIFEYTLPGLLHHHPTAFSVYKNASAVLLTILSLRIRKADTRKAATAASR